MALSEGSRIGPYEVAALIGQGGMGEVYRATDTTLGRAVALKVLPAAVAQEPERLARFEREARILAALSHPNIAHVHGFERADGVTALVMELVEGPTLAERLSDGARRSGLGSRTGIQGSRLPVDEALPIARQIVDALEAAHAQGIVHRDLKPANIKVRDDGTVKVLDFGLAKAMDSAGSGQQAGGSLSPSLSPTITTPAMTQAGMILGTAAYMAPEQARGKPVDKRADIWAFGCVLYEMLTGRRVFQADEVSDTLALVLTRDPDWNALPSDTPAAIRRLLRRCLAKDRQARLPDIGSARLEIDEARSEPQSATLPPDTTSTRRARPSKVLGTAATAAGVLLGALVTWVATKAPAADRPVSRVLIGVAPAERLLSGFQGDASLGQGRPSRTSIALSADGRSIVFSAERNGQVQLYLRRLDQLDAAPIPGTEGASNPFLSPDGQWIGFHANGALRKVPLGGGPPVELAKVPLLYGATWNRSNQIVFAGQRGGLWAVSSAGGTPTQVTTPDTAAGDYSHRLPQFLPDGTTVLFTVTRSLFPSWDDDTLIVAQSLASGERKVLVEGGADARFVSTGRLLYLRRGTLMTVPFDPERLEVTGASVGVASDVLQAAGIQPVQVDTGAGQFAASESGSLVYATGGVFRADRWSIVWMDRTGKAEPLDLPPGSYFNPHLSPDGLRVAFTIASDDWDIATYDLARRSLSRLPMEGEQSIALWSPDGSHLAFSNFSKGARSVFWRLADGTGTPERLTTMEGWPNSWTPDGALTFLDSGSRRGIWLAPERGAQPKPLFSGSESGSHAEFSPDGKWLAFNSGARGSTHVYVRPYPALDRQQKVSIEPGSLGPTWRRDGRELYFTENVSGDGPLKVRVMAVPITTSPTFSAGTPRALFEGAFRTDGPVRSYDVTPDGQRFLMVQEVPLPPSRVSQMVLVQNWSEELKSR